MKTTTKDHSTKLSLILVLLSLLIASITTSCAGQKQIYKPTKANKNLKVCDHTGCYAKK